MMRFFRRQSPARLIAFGFAAVILLGSGLLSLPCSIRPSASHNYIDALYTATSAVCVTGLLTVDAGSTYTLFGQIVILLLIQIGGLGVTSIGAGVILATHRKMGLKERILVREASNLGTGKGIIKFIKSVFLTTVAIEGVGIILNFIAFIRNNSFWDSLWYSIFHSVSSFNNSGFDVFGKGSSMIPYQNDVFMCLVTSCLIITGGIGFLVIREIIDKRFSWKRFSMHTKVVLSVSAALLIIGMLLIKLAEWNNVSWLGAFFMSVSARTAGFTVYPLSGFGSAALLTVIALMVIGASPGSTGGGIKTTTFFALFRGIKSSATNSSEKAFKYSLPSDAFRKSAVIILLAIAIILTGAFLILLFEANNASISFSDVLFEAASAFGTAGLSTGITSKLGVASKLVSMVIMYIGRLGPLTVATLWYFNKGERVSYPEGNMSIG